MIQFFKTLSAVVVLGIFIIICLGVGGCVIFAFGDEPTLYQYDGGVLLTKQKLSSTVISDNASDVYALWENGGRWIKGGEDQEPPAQAILDMVESKEPKNGGKKPIITQLKEVAQKQKFKVGDLVVHNKKICKIISIDKESDFPYHLESVANDYYVNSKEMIPYKWGWEKIGDKIYYPEYIQDKEGNYIVGDATTNPIPNPPKQRRKPDALITNPNQ